MTSDSWDFKLPLSRGLTATYLVPRKENKGGPLCWTGGSGLAFVDSEEENSP